MDSVWRVIDLVVSDSVSTFWSRLFLFQDRRVLRGDLKDLMGLNSKIDMPFKGFLNSARCVLLFRASGAASGFARVFTLNF